MNPLVYEPNLDNNYDFSYFDQPPQYHIDQSPPLDPYFQNKNLDDFKMQIMESMESILRRLRSDPPVSLIDIEEVDDVSEVIVDEEQFLRQHNTAHVTPPPLVYTPPPPFLATMESLDTFLMGDEVISTIPTWEIDEFIKSSVEDLASIPMESKVTLVSIVLECSMPIDSPSLPCTDVLGDAILDIDLPFGEHLDTLSTGDREINFNPSRDIEELERLLSNNPIPIPRVIDEPLGNSNSMSRSSETSNLFEEFIAKIGLDNSIPTGIDDRYYDSDGDILYFEQLLDEDTSSDLSPTLLPTESSSLVIPLPDFKQVCLKEVARFDPFFSLTQSGDVTWVMERPSYRFPLMPLPRQVAYSPKVVMYRYFHPHLILSDGCDHEPRNK
ncbi:hypothetical protein Tco_0210310 [Tanacetum coccineum]